MLRIPKLHTGRTIWAAAVIAALLVFNAKFRLAIVVGDSMRPGFATGDLLVVDKLAYRNYPMHRGDVVLARLGGEYIVKRVIGLPGEEVSVHTGRLLINGYPVREEYPLKRGFLDIGPGRLFRGKYALLGDNRELGMSQIVHAVISERECVGRVIWTWRLRSSESTDVDTQ